MLLSSTVMTPSLPTLSIASAMISPTVVSAAEIDAVEAICSLVSTSLASLASSSATAATAASMPRLRAIGLAPAATLRRPSRTSAWARTVAVVVPSPATSSVFLATSLTSSAPIFSYGSSSSISLAMLTPSLVMVGAPHFFSSTTLRPLGPERHLDGVGEDVHAPLEAAAGLLVERDQSWPFGVVLLDSPDRPLARRSACYAPSDVDRLPTRVRRSGRIARDDRPGRARRPRPRPAAPPPRPLALTWCECQRPV